MMKQQRRRRASMAECLVNKFVILLLTLLIVNIILLCNPSSQQTHFAHANSIQSNDEDSDEIIDLDQLDEQLKSVERQPSRERPMMSTIEELITRRIKPGGSSHPYDSGNNNHANSHTTHNTIDTNSNAHPRPHNSPYNRRGRKKSKSPSDPRKPSSSTDDNSIPIIATKVTVTIPGYGKAEGRREQAVDTWKGIPYASPPVGSLRLAPPEAATPWAPSKLDASQYGPDCYQLVDPVLNPLASSNMMSEDCLYLNVFAPAGHVARSRQGKFLNPTKKLP
eukprot:scaffold1024_cov233-Chaetoceros_neogracile.AAC.1